MKAGLKKTDTDNKSREEPTDSNGAATSTRRQPASGGGVSLPPEQRGEESHPAPSCGKTCCLRGRVCGSRTRLFGHSRRIPGVSLQRRGCRRPAFAGVPAQPLQCFPGRHLSGAPSSPCTCRTIASLAPCPAAACDRRQQRLLGVCPWSGWGQGEAGVSGRGSPPGNSSDTQPPPRHRGPCTVDHRPATMHWGLWTGNCGPRTLVRGPHWRPCTMDLALWTTHHAAQTVDRAR